MGNKKTKRLAGQLLKSYGFNKRFTDRKRGNGSSSFIVSILSLSKGDLVFEGGTGCNHPVIGFLAETNVYDNKQYSRVYHTVYEGMLLGSGAFSIDPPRKNAPTFCLGNEMHDRMTIEEHCGEFVSLREKNNA